MSDTIWLNHYPPGVSAEITASNETLVSMFDHASQKYQHKPALSCHDHTLNFSEVNHYANRFATYCYDQLGLRKGDHVAIMLPNILQFPIVVFGLLKIGCVFISINPLYTGTEVKHILENSQAKAAIVLSYFAHHIEAAMATLPHLQYAMVTDIADCYPFVKRQVIHFIARYIKGMKSSYIKTKFYQFSNAIHYNMNSNLPDIAVTPDDIACLQYSSGTTGTPKGTILLHRNIVANIHQIWQWVSPTMALEKQVIIGALPLYHIFALTANLFTFYFTGSKQVLIPNPRDINFLIKTLQKNPFTVFNSLNTLYAALLGNKKFQQSQFEHFKFSLSGGMSTTQKIADEWKKTTGVTIKEAYGLSEMSPAVTINRLDGDEFNNTVGYPLPSTLVSIRDLKGNVLSTEQKGEIWVKGPQQSPGFWQMEQVTKEHFTEDGWLKTGDIGFLDEMGRFSISRRCKNMLIVSGFNVFPKEVENVCYLSPLWSHFVVTLMAPLDCRHNGATSFAP